MTKYLPYVLSGEQVKALEALFYAMNLASLSHRGVIVAYDKISPEQGRILEEIFYSETFGEEAEED